ncbi:MAG: FecR domain-containing protein [Planctomycetaceae bacterium]|nr:FecR domain-containing protein [Planctomycetaceae bacterium]
MSISRDESRFQVLWTDFLEGELEDAPYQELRGMLAADAELLEEATRLYQTHHLLGLLAAEEPSREEAFVQETMARLPVSQDRLVSRIMSKLPHSREKAFGPRAGRSWRQWIAPFALLCVLVLYLQYFSPGGRHIAPTPAGNTASLAELGTQGDVRLANQSRARFFGELASPTGSSVPTGREYVLIEGLVELSFPQGATAIIEGPAVYRVLSTECLAMDMGRCSVHAPDGAEGFRVETPSTRVVDRGTRFTVSVSELNETDVQVVEGAADVYRYPHHAPRHDDAEEVEDLPLVKRLVHGEARRFTGAGSAPMLSVPFDPAAYRALLPDRVVSYEATRENGGARELLDVTIQRGGKLQHIPAAELIPAEVVWFRGNLLNVHLVGEDVLPEMRTWMSSDFSLITGIINPGGSETPLTSNPILQRDEATGEMGTPGMAFRFERPVVNGPGADVVLFDIQSFSNPPQGDAFHVSPLHFREGLKSHTIQQFDLTMESPAALDIASFNVFRFEEPINSPGELERIACVPQRQVVKFRALAVGIDLSDLGYADGEEVAGLFIQDALDDKHYIDPVFVGGLPTRETGER